MERLCLEDFRESDGSVFKHNLPFLYSHSVLRGINLNNNKLKAERLCPTILRNQTLLKKKGVR
jgi:hypothetical protein